MRRLLTLLTSALLAACTTAPDTAVESTPAPGPAHPSGQRRLIGLTGQELANRLGRLPTLQIREGSGIKLQFRSSQCVLDAYLYPPAKGGLPRVEHVDARSPSGADRDEQQCLLDFQAGAS